MNPGPKDRDSYFVKDDQTPWSHSKTLEQYIRSLLKSGKRSQDPAFQHLFAAFGKEKVTRIARNLLAVDPELKSPQSP